MSIDWSEIKCEFDDMRLLLETIPSAPTEQQIDAHTIARTLKLSSVLDKFPWGYYSHGSAKTRKRMRDLETAIKNETSRGFVVIGEAIDSQTCSTQFLMAWGYLGQLFGRFDELMLRSDTERLGFEQSVAAGLSQSTLIQRYWHAHWITVNSKPDLGDRKDVEAGLAKLCADVWQGRLRSPSGFPPEWFESLIRAGLKKKLSDFSRL